MANGSTRQYVYDPVDQLTTQIELNSTLQPIMTMIDGYDGVGNRTSRVQDGFATTWSYDPKYRLTGQAASGQTATFGYSPIDNMTLKWHQGESPLTMTYDFASRIATSLLGVALTTFGFDNN